MVTDPRSRILKDLYRLSLLLKKLSYETALKWKINLIRPNYELHICPVKSKKDA
jgi:hypothetical protein